MQKSKTIKCFLIFFFLCSLFNAQTDTLNKFNEKNYYEGWWKIFYDANFNITEDTLNAKYYDYECYANGKLYRGIFDKTVGFYKANYQADKIKYVPFDTLHKSKALNGQIFYYYKKGSLSFLEVFKNGVITTSNSYLFILLDGEISLIYQEYSDWTLRYENNSYSYYFEIIDDAILSGKTKIKRCYVTFSQNGKRKLIKIKERPIGSSKA